MADASSSITEGLQLCLQLLSGECTKEELTNAVNVLIKLSRNAQQNPKEEKFRKVRKENNTFKQKVWRFDGAQQFMFAAGWTEVEDQVVLTDDSFLTQAVQVLQPYTSQSPPKPPNITATVNPAWSSREAQEKERLLQEERKRQMEKVRKDKEEKKRIAEQIRADRAETSTRQNTDSHARQMRNTGSGMKRFDDIGINLNQGGG